MEDGIDLIQARRAELRRERARLVESLAAIDAEEKELEITERTLSRLVVGPMKAGVTVAGTPHRAAPGFRAPKRGSRRPDNIPSTPVMINLALIDAEAQGKRGLSAKELLASIAGKWWPGVGTNNILPDAARLVRSGKLSRVDGLYIRVRSEKDSETTAPRPSQDENR